MRPTGRKKKERIAQVRLSHVALSDGHAEVHPTHEGDLLGIDQPRNRTRPRRSVARGGARAPRRGARAPRSPVGFQRRGPEAPEAVVERQALGGRGRRAAADGGPRKPRGRGDPRARAPRLLVRLLVVATITK